DPNCFQLVDGTFKPTPGSDSLLERFGRAPDAQGYGWGVRSNHLFCVHPQIDVTIPNYRAFEGWRITAASDGGMWLIASRIQKFHPPSSSDLTGQFEDFGPIPVVTDQFTAYLTDRSGNLWVGTGVGELWRIGTNHRFRRFKFPDSTTLE